MKLPSTELEYGRDVVVRDLPLTLRHIIILQVVYQQTQLFRLNAKTVSVQPNPDNSINVGVSIKVDLTYDLSFTSSPLSGYCYVTTTSTYMYIKLIH